MKDCVYFIRPVGQAGPIKIGFTSVAKQRLHFLTKWSPVPLEIIVMAPGGYQVEQALHAKFSRYRQHCEWFTASDEILSFIESLVKGQSINSLVSIDGCAPRKGTKKDYNLGAATISRDHYRLAVENVFLALSGDRGVELYPPREVTALLNNWPDRPTPDEFRLLDHVLARPGDHAKTADEIWPLSVSAAA